MKKRLFFLFPILLTTFACLSCAENRDTGREITEIQASETLPESEEIREASDDVPELNFDGASFRTIIQSSTIKDMYAEEQTGDVLLDAIYLRNRAAEERLGVVIPEPVQADFTKLSGIVKSSVSAGDDAFDLVIGQMEQTGQDALDGLYLNWHDIPYTDFEKPWWPESVARNAATVSGKMYSVVSDLCISFAEQTWSIVFDKVKAEKAGVTGIYDTVSGGKWTVDAFQTVIKGAYSDLNGNSKQDKEDLYGLACSPSDGCCLLSFVYGFGQRLAVVENGSVNMVLNSEKAASVFSKMYELYHESEDSFAVTGSCIDLFEFFGKGSAVFCPYQIGAVYSMLRDYENDYGIIPMPKWNEEQSAYYAVTDAGCSVLTVPVICGNTEMAGAVTEVLSAYSYEKVLPVYYDISLKTKGTRDEESAAILDTVLKSRVIDFAYLYDGWNGWVFKLSEMIKSADSFSSVYARHEKAMQTYYDKVLSYFSE